jgi:hypothetical protein
MKEPVYVRPEDRSNLEDWAKKWGVTYGELYQAILHTGCLEAEKLKEYVQRDKWLYHPVSSTAKMLKQGINLIF